MGSNGKGKPTELLGTLEGGEIRVQLRGEGQDILFEDVGRCRLMAAVLGVGTQPRRVGRSEDGRQWIVVSHTREVDRIIYELVDILISMRMMHPTMVQLKLQLTEEEASEFEEVMSGSAS